MRIYNIYNLSTFPLNCLQAWAMEANRGAGGIVEQQPRHSENSIFDLVCSGTNWEEKVAAEA
jgi:hypothetical protein